MCLNQACYKTCINNVFLIDDELLMHAQEIVVKLLIKSSVGRPPIEFEIGLNGFYYLIKTGIQWKALPLGEKRNELLWFDRYEFFCILLL